MTQPVTRFALGVTLGTRCAVFLVGWLAVATIGHAPGMGPRPTNELAELPSRWDAPWYLGLASGGYRWEGPGHHNSRLAFFPGFSITLRAAAKVLNLPADRATPWLWTGVALSTLYFWLALVYLHRLTDRFAGPEAARQAITLLALYPFSLFHGQVYTESLFLLTAVASTFYAYKDDFVRATIFGFAAGLVRPTGCLVGLLVGWAVVSRFRERRGIPVATWVAAGVAVASSALGTLSYCAYVKYLTGSWFTWLTDQTSWGRVLQNPLGLAAGVAAAIRVHGFQGYVMAQPYEFLNVVAAIFALAMAVPVFRQMGLGAATFVVLSVLAPLRVGGFASMGRYTCVLFPIFVSLGAARKGAKVLVPSFAILLGLMACLFFTDRPIF